MDTKGLSSWTKVEWFINALLVTAVLLILTNVVWGLDIQDITIEWTEAGRQMAMDRVKTWPAKDDMVLVPAGQFLMGSDKKTDRNAYVTELPQRTATWMHLKSPSMK